MVLLLFAVNADASAENPIGYNSVVTIHNLYYLHWPPALADNSAPQPAWRHELNKWKPEYVPVVVLVLVVSIILIKAYAIGIIWRCYKFLTIRRDIMLPYVIPVISARRVRF